MPKCRQKIPVPHRRKSHGPSRQTPSRPSQKRLLPGLYNDLEKRRPEPPGCPPPNCRARQRRIEMKNGLATWEPPYIYIDVAVGPACRAGPCAVLAQQHLARDLLG